MHQVRQNNAKRQHPRLQTDAQHSSKFAWNWLITSGFHIRGILTPHSWPVWFPKAHALVRFTLPASCKNLPHIPIPQKVLAPGSSEFDGDNFTCSTPCQLVCAEKVSFAGEPLLTLTGKPANLKVAKSVCLTSTMKFYTNLKNSANSNTLLTSKFS